MVNPKDDEEMRKRITALALAGDPMVLLDNVAGSLGTPSLDAALTSVSWNDRILGRSQTTGRLPLNVLWFATANNVALNGDTTRRVLHIRLDTREEKPEERSGCAHPDLRQWIRRERPRLIRAALTLLAGFFQAGKPDQNLAPWGSFEEWSSVIRNAVVWCGLPDPAEGRRELVEKSDRELGSLRALFAVWDELDPNEEGLSAQEVLVAADQVGAARAALSELAPGKRGKPLDAQRLGKRLHSYRKRTVDGRYLDTGVVKVRNTQRWFLRRTVRPEG